MRHLDIATAAPVAVTPAQLARGVGVPLDVHEIRLANHNNVIGACTRLGPEISDPGDRCGKRAYRIPASAVKLRLRGDRLAFSFVRVAADPYGNHCAPSVWGAVPQSGSAELVATLRFPPKAVSAPLVDAKARRRQRVGCGLERHLLDRRRDARAHRCELDFVAGRTNFRLGQDPPHGRRARPDVLPD